MRAALHVFVLPLEYERVLLLSGLGGQVVDELVFQLVDGLGHLDLLLEGVRVLHGEANRLLEVLVGRHFQLYVFAFFAFEVGAKLLCLLDDQWQLILLLLTERLHHRLLLRV